MSGPSSDLPPIADAGFDLIQGLGPESDDLGLRAAIVAEIEAAGKISFRRFMELALYHPARGYYTRGRRPIGRDADYVTSPEISPLFGYALARQLAECWRALGQPASFGITEYGAGSGRLASDILSWIGNRDRDFFDSLTYRLIDRSPAAAAQQNLSLEPFLDSNKVQVSTKLADQAQYGCVLANELLDSFPVHRVRFQDGSLEEIYVTVDGGNFVEQHGPPSTPALDSYFKRLGLLPGERMRRRGEP